MRLSTVSTLIREHTSHAGNHSVAAFCPHVLRGLSSCFCNGHVFGFVCFMLIFQLHPNTNKHTNTHARMWPNYGGGKAAAAETRHAEGLDCSQNFPNSAIIWSQTLWSFYLLPRVADRTAGPKSIRVYPLRDKLTQSMALLKVFSSRCTVSVLPSEGFCSTRLSSSVHSVLSLFISL